MSIVLRPRMSEKTYSISKNGVFVFNVDGSLNKHQVAEAVAKDFSVEVKSVRIVIQKGKAKRTYRNKKFESGVRSDVKKAYVTLAKGQSIPIFAAVEEAEAEEAKATEKAEKKAKKAKKAEEKK